MFFVSIQAMIKEKTIEIMSPAGSFETLVAAIQGGADSVYFGVGKLNMRARGAVNFKISDLSKVVKICHKNKVKAYLALNTLVYDEDVKEIKKICVQAKKAGVDAVIASDLAAITYARVAGLEVHISTQANVSNFEAVKFFSKYAEVVVLARELTLEQIKKIISRCRKEKILGPSKKPIRFELFVHGALCVAIAGKCQMSLALYNHSANRGDCFQVCRRKYKVMDLDTNDELVVDNQYIMSPSDLSTISFLDKIIESGVSVLKIEGRGRSADYVYTTTKIYKEAGKSVLQKEFDQKKVGEWIERLKTVFNRGFWQGGYYLGKKLGEWSGAYGSQATQEKEFVGTVNHYFPKAKVGEFFLNSGGLKEGDEIIITGSKTGIIQTVVESLFVKDHPAKKAQKGDVVTIKLATKIRKSDKLFVVRKK